MRFAFALFAAAIIAVPLAVFAQSESSASQPVSSGSTDRSVPRIPILPKPVITELHRDSGYYAIPPADSARMYDSIYKLRRAEFEERQRLAIAQTPREDFITISASASALDWFKGQDLSQYFAERSARPNPISDRPDQNLTNYYITLGAQLHLTTTTAITIDYNLISVGFDTFFDSDFYNGAPLPNTDEILNSTYHLLMIGLQESYPISHRVQLFATGAAGPAIDFVSEQESSSGASRSSSAVGYVLSFDAGVNVRFVEWASFDFDFFARSITTSTLTTSGGQNLSQPFGWHTTAFDIAPKGTASVIGFSIGGKIYF